VIFSVGHSRHNPATFAHIIEGIDTLIDVRSHPTSRMEWWRLAAMQEWLPAYGIDVAWMPELGGWDRRHLAYAEPLAEVGVDVRAYTKGVFPKQRIAADRGKVPEGTAPEWQNVGLYDYAWYMSLPEFHRGLERLITSFAGRAQPKVAIMCCEAQWWRCHRGMVSDALLYAGVDVMHLKSPRPKRPTTMRWTYHSEHVGNRLHRYPQAVRASWDTAGLKHLAAA
jgi:uncharacterized protein (DUF488 family)